MTQRITFSLSIFFGLILVLAVLGTIPAKGANQASIPLLEPDYQETPADKLAQEIAVNSGVGIDMVKQMLAAGLTPQEINTIDVHQSCSSPRPA